MALTADEELRRAQAESELDSGGYLDDGSDSSDDGSDSSDGSTDDSSYYEPEKKKKHKPTVDPSFLRYNPNSLSLEDFGGPEEPGPAPEVKKAEVVATPTELATKQLAPEEQKTIADIAGPPSPAAVAAVTKRQGIADTLIPHEDTRGMDDVLSQTYALLSDEDRKKAEAYDKWDWSREDPPDDLVAAYQKRQGIFEDVKKGQPTPLPPELGGPAQTTAPPATSAEPVQQEAPPGEPVDWGKLGYKSFNQYEKFVNSLGVQKAVRGPGTTAILADINAPAPAAPAPAAPVKPGEPAPATTLEETAPGAKPSVSTQKILPNGLLENEDPKSFVVGTATTFSGAADRARYDRAIALGATPRQALQVGDNGVGAARVGGLQTADKMGIALPPAVLHEYLGANAGNWRRARVLVVDPTTGRRLLLPVIDLGPSDEQLAKGIVADLTPYVDQYFNNRGGGKKLMFKIIPEAGPDVNANPREFAAEQNALRQGKNLTEERVASQKAQLDAAREFNRQRVHRFDPGESQFAQMSREQQATVTSQFAKLSEKYKNYDNLGSVYQDIDKNSDIPAQVRERFKANLQESMTQDMIQYSPELREMAASGPQGQRQAEELAWAKWHNSKGEVISPSGLSMNVGDGINADSIKDLWSRVQGMHEQFAANLRGDPIENQRKVLDKFWQYTGADSEDKKTEILNKIHELPYGPERFNYITSLLPQGSAASLAPQASQVDDALRNLGDAGWMQAHSGEHAKDLKLAAVKMAGDPRMRATFGAGVNDAVATMVNMAEVGAVPLGFQIQAGDQERTKIKTQHPDWSEEQINEQAWKGTLINSYGLELGGKIFSTIAAPLLKNIGNPVARRAANALASALGLGTTTAGASVLTNAVSGEPLDWEAAKRAGVQGAALGLIHGAMHGPPGRETATREPAPPAPPQTADRTIPQLEYNRERARTTPQLEHVPVIEPEFEHIPADRTQTEPVLKHGRVWEQVPRAIGGDDAILQDNYTGPRALPQDTSEAHTNELNGRNRQLLLEDRRGTGEAGPPRSGPSTVVGEAERAQPSVTPSGAGDSRAGTTRPDLFGPPRAPATTHDEALAQVKGYHDGYVKLINAMGWKHDPTVDPQVKLGTDGHSIIVGGTAQHFSDWAKAHGVKDPAAIVEAVRHGMDEEITHALDFHSMRDEYDAQRVAGKVVPGEAFPQWASREARRATVELFNAHDQAVAAKDHALAKMIRSAFDHSNKMYHDGALSWDGLRKYVYGDPRSTILPKTAGDNLFRMRMELARQLDQAARRGNMTEGNIPSWKRVAKSLSDWFGKIVNSFKATHAVALQGKLGPQMQKHLQGLINKRRAMDAIAHGFRPPADTAEPSTKPSDVSAELKKPTYTPQTWREKAAYAAQMLGAKAGTLHSALFKSGESFGLDHPTTEKLGQALRNNPDYKQKIAAVTRIPELKRAMEAVPWHRRTAVSKEFSDWFKARDRNQPAPALSPEAKRMVDATNTFLNRSGQIATNMGIKVQDEHGKTKPFQALEDYFPRILSKDTEAIFEHRDGSRKADFDKLYADALRKGVAKTRAEFIEKFEKSTVPDTTSNAFFSNVEHTRTMHLPMEMHDWSPEAIVRYASRMVDRLSDIKSFGQKLGPHTLDLFDHTAEAIAKDPDLTPSQKRMMQTRVNQERNAAYSRHFVDNFSTASGKLRSTMASTALGNWFSSANNLMGGAVSNLAYGGPVSAAKAYGRYITGWLHGKGGLKLDAEDRGILSHNLRDMTGDFARAGDQNWMTRGLQGYNRGMMKWGGQNETETINRTVAMQQAKYILAKAQKWLAPGANKGIAGTRTRDRIEFMKRRGFSDSDLRALWNEGGDPNKHFGEKFIRQYVMDSHGSYSPGQTASWMFDSPVGKMLLQFQKFGANQWRMQSREFIMPGFRTAAEALKNPTRENITDAGYQAARNLLHFGFVVPAAGMAINAAIGFAKDKKSEQASWYQLWNEVQKGQYGPAFWHYLLKVHQAYMLTGMTGPIANGIGIGLSWAGISKDKQKDWRNPPVFSVLLQPLYDYLSAAHQETGGDWSKLPSAMADSHILGKFLSSISGLRSLYQAAGAMEHRFGVDDPIFHAGRDVGNANNMFFLRSRLRMYEESHPELSKTGTYSPVRTVFSPYREDILNNLLSGNSKGAMEATRKYLETVPAPEVEGKLKSIKESVNSSSPIKPGGGTSEERQLDFLRWVKETQSPEDARQIFNLAQTYARTALATGIFGSPAMKTIAELNFNLLPLRTLKEPGGAQKGKDLLSAMRANQLLMPSR